MTSATLRDCPRCKGAGVIYLEGRSLNPYSGLVRRDPQCDESADCPYCGGFGAIADKQTNPNQEEPSCLTA